MIVGHQRHHRVMKFGGRWIDAPEVYGACNNTLRSLHPLGRKGRMGSHIPGTRVGRRTSCRT